MPTGQGFAMGQDSMMFEEEEEEGDLGAIILANVLTIRALQKPNAR
jgi:hypothetical protein